MRLQPNWYVIVKTDEGDAFITDREGNSRIRCRPTARPSAMFERFAVEIVRGLNFLGISAEPVEYPDSIPEQFHNLYQEHVYYWNKPTFSENS
jgi:hypothetical protein